MYVWVVVQLSCKHPAKEMIVNKEKRMKIRMVCDSDVMDDKNENKNRALLCL